MISYELSSRLADSSLTYTTDGKIRVSDELQGAARSAVQRTFGYHVSAFTPSDGAGGHVPLDASNFEAALVACIAAARAASPVRAVLIPAGVWSMTASLVLTGNGYNAMPTIYGEGRDNTTLSWPNVFTGVCVDLDGSADHFAGGGLEDLSISSPGDGGRGVGLRFSHILFTVFRNLYIGGFAYQGNDGWEHGVGVWGLGNYGVIQNNQNTLFDNVAIRACTTNARLAACTQFVLIHTQFNQGHGFGDLILEGSADISMFGGMFQSQNDTTALAYNVYKNHDFVPIRTMGGKSDGTHRYVATGSAASLGAVSGGLVTVTGLVGMAATDVGSGHLYFRNAASDGNGGIFEIAAYIDSTSVQVYKKNGGIDTNNGALVWEKYLAEGGTAMSLHGVAYHEGPIAACIKTSRPVSAGNTVRFFLHGLTVNNCSLLLDLNGTDTCEVSGVTGHYDPATFVWVKARACRQITILGGPSMVTVPQAYDLDQFSREHITVNGQTALAGRSGSLTDILRAAAAEVIDPGAAGAVTLVGGYIDAISGAIAGTSVAAPTSGRRCVWIPQHPRLGGKPAIGVRDASDRTLSGTLSTAIPSGAYPGIFVIAHLPAGYANSGALRGVRASGAGGRFILASISDGVISATGDLLGYYNPGSGSIAANRVLGGRRTFALLVQPRILNEDVIGNGAAHSLVVDKAGQETHGVISTPLTGTLTTLEIGDAAGGADLDIAYAAFLKRPLTLEEEKALFAAAEEYLQDTTPANPPAASTGAFTVSSLFAPVLVSISGGSATATLPAGHQAGDEVLIKVVTAAGGNTCTIDAAGAETIDGAATRVLSTDYASVRLRSDGTNWFTI